MKKTLRILCVSLSLSFLVFGFSPLDYVYSDESQLCSHSSSLASPTLENLSGNVNQIVCSATSTRKVPFVIRAFLEKDIGNLNKFYTDDPSASELFGIHSSNFKKFLQKSIKNPDRISFTISTPRNDEAIGLVSFRGVGSGNPVISYLMNPKYRGQNITTESIVNLIPLIFRIKGVKKIIATTRIFNESSKAVLNKAGFKYIGTDEDDPNKALFELQNPDQLGKHGIDSVMQLSENPSNFLAYFLKGCNSINFNSFT